MKNLLVAIIAVFAITVAHAQEQGKVRVGFDMGYAVVYGGGGLLINVEPKYNIAENMNVGVRFGLAAVFKNIITDGYGDVSSASISASSSYMGTFDYYFVMGGAFNPFAGAGIGYVGLASVAVDGTAEYGDSSYTPDGKLGLMLRGGFEAAKFRFTLEYDMIGKTTLQDYQTGADYGSIKNNYFGIVVGFYVGGGRW